MVVWYGGTRHDDGVGSGHVMAGFNDGRAQQHLKRWAAEVFHDLQSSRSGIYMGYDNSSGRISSSFCRRF
jgi:hypothetical protein